METKIYDKNPEPVVEEKNLTLQADAMTLEADFQEKIEKEDTDKMELVGELVIRFLFEMVEAGADGVNFWEGVKLFQSGTSKAKIVGKHFGEVVEEVKDLSPAEAEKVYAKLGKSFFSHAKNLEAKKSQFKNLKTKSLKK